MFCVFVYVYGCGPVHTMACVEVREHSGVSSYLLPYCRKVLAFPYLCQPSRGQACKESLVSTSCFIHKTDLQTKILLHGFWELKLRNTVPSDLHPLVLLPTHSSAFSFTALNVGSITFFYSTNFSECHTFGIYILI